MSVQKKAGLTIAVDQPPIRRKEYYDVRQKNNKIKAKNAEVLILSANAAEQYMLFSLNFAFFCLFLFKLYVIFGQMPNQYHLIIT
jgi:hypothetical protein